MYRNLHLLHHTFFQVDMLKLIKTVWRMCNVPIRSNIQNKPLSFTVATATATIFARTI